MIASTLAGTPLILYTAEANRLMAHKNFSKVAFYKGNVASNLRNFQNVVKAAKNQDFEIVNIRLFYEIAT